MKKILILNGPNLNLLGTRQPEIYGTATMEQCLERLHRDYPGVDIHYLQSNHEGDLIDAIHRAAADGFDGIALNAGAYTHTSLAIADAISSVGAPVIEVHLSNVMAREPIRRQSLIAPACKGTVAGFGMDSYRLAVEHFVNCKLWNRL